jgi:hypothetical protein
MWERIPQFDRGWSFESEGFERLNIVVRGMDAVRHGKRPRLPAMELAGGGLTWEI